ncbi:ATP-binding SpoIIE family protein phosphatase [Kitasatospora sp. NPDC096147]|uniref:ATP-binding SpoIIE family protein phosphatase n=1 Tax=Kitasatospora sp. NPDC096147 TaxID=3364093 RepID=UPI003809297B
MGAVRPVLTASEDVAWYRDEPSLPAAARGAAAALARRIGLGDQRAAEVALAVSEAATNLCRHAVDGSLLLRVVRTPSEAGLEFVTVDAGPGMADVPHALTDGTSSAGTLGIGLGAISRLADSFDLHSLPGRGTVLAARFWARPAGPRARAEQGPPVAGLTRPISGEQICGDAWAARPAAGGVAGEAAEPVAAHRATAAPALSWAALTGLTGPSGPTGRSPGPDRPGLRPAPTARPTGPADPDALLVMLCDGLGHGPLAARASQDAVAAFHESRAVRPETVLADVHRALRGGRGGAVAVALIRPAARRLLFCGVGNVSTYLLDPAAGTRRALVSAPGIVGHHLPPLHSVELELPAGSAVVMHSDGLTDRWRSDDLPGLLDHTPLVAAAQLLREAAVRRDDAGVLVAKGPW